MRLSALLALLAALSLCAPARAEPERGHLGPVPSWVGAVDTPASSGHASGDTEALLVDRQVRVEGDHTLLYRHVVYVVRTTAGVQNNSEINVGRASDETVTWHFVRRGRGGAFKELLPRLDIKVIQPESRRSDGIYDGSRREMVFLEDVRVGDVIEYAYTVREDNAVLDGRYSGVHWVGESYAVRKLSLRVSWPAERKMEVRAFGVAPVRPSDHELTVEQSDVPESQVAAHEPDWFASTPRIVLSEFASWADVVSWALPHYAYAPHAELEAKASELRAAATPLERMTRAVRFIQDEVRYLGLEEGVRAVVPHAPADVLARRYGDCKDKALLLVALLRALGFEAEVALVNTDLEGHVTELLPAPSAFNHAIVHTTFEGQELWLDATSIYERGPVTADANPRFGRALLVRAGERELRAIAPPLATTPDEDVAETFTLSGEGSATLRVHTTYRRDAANAARVRFATTERAELEKRYLDFYAREYGNLEARSPLVISDDEQNNVIEVSEHYTIEEFWKDGEQRVRAWLLADELPEIEASRASVPVALPWPRHLRHVIELYNTDGWRTDDQQLTVAGTGFHYAFKAGSRGKSETITHELRTTADHVPPGELAQYRRNVTQLGEQLGSWYNTGPEPEQPEAKDVILPLAVIAGLVFIIWVTWRIFIAATGNAGKRDRRPVRFAPGEAPESALAAADRGDVNSLLARVTCCEGPIFAELPGEPSSVRYGDALLAVYKQSCGQCGRVHTRYFRDR